MTTEQGGLRKVILIIALIILILFVLVWLFPTKQYVTNQIENITDEKIKNTSSYNAVFNENIKFMQESATAYFTNSRLPKEIGDKVTISLEKMLDSHLIVEFTDAEGQKCSSKDSYAEITKENSEYILKVNLSCNKQTDYIIVHMGDYDYCTSTICEKKKIDDTQETTNNVEVEQNRTNVINNKAKISPKQTSKIVTKKAIKVTNTTYSCPNGYSLNGTKCLKNENPKAEKHTRILNGKTYYQTVYICDSAYKNEGRYASKVECQKEINAIETINATYVCDDSFDNKGSYNTEVTCTKKYN